MNKTVEKKKKHLRKMCLNLHKAEKSTAWSPLMTCSWVN